VRNEDKAREAFGDAPGLEIVVGPFDDQTVLDEALDDVELAFLALGSSPLQVQLEKGFIDAAAGANLPQLVKLSTADARHESLVPVGRWHAEIEDHLHASGVPHTLLQPSSFSINLLAAAAPSISHGDRWFGSAPTGHSALVDTRDVSEAAAVVIRQPNLYNATYVLTGPQALSNPEIAEIFSRVLGREVSYVPVDDDTVRKGIAGAGLPDLVADIAVGINQSVEAGAQETVTDDLEQVLGRAPRTVEQFISDHRAAFSK
jgi:uncharacterized protein YbjT (DUF2867 family)